jgi:hypothetical protein
MGLNIFKRTGVKEYLTGSFNGVYLWDTETGRINDFFTGQPYMPPEGMVSPVGDNMAGGIVTAGSDAWWFDYSRGAASITGMPFPEMPEEIIEESPISIWNVALEVHTGRIFEHITGPFYILYVPLSGLCLLMVLISGFFIWWKSHRKRS